MINPTELKALLNTGSYSDDLVIAAEQLNAKTVGSKKVIDTDDVERFFMIADVWLGIKHSNDPAAETVRDALEKFPSFDMRDSMISAYVVTILSGLVTAGLMTEPLKNQLLALSDDLMSPAQVAGFDKVTPGDVQRARVA